MAKVTGKFQITLPKAVVDQYGIRVGDELEFRPAGASVQIDRRGVPEMLTRRRDRLSQFDEATARQRAREGRPLAARARSRGWRREDLYVRARTR